MVEKLWSSMDDFSEFKCEPGEMNLVLRALVLSERRLRPPELLKLRRGLLSRNGLESGP